MKAISRWDTYVVLANRYNWTPEQVDALDPDFYEQIMAFLRAEGVVEAAKRK